MNIHGCGSPPTPGIPSDGFSVRWWRETYFNAGTYRFTASSDDGIRVYVYRPQTYSEKPPPVVEGGWYDHPARTFVSEIDLTEGLHRVVVEYYENTGLAMAKVTWNLVSTPSEGWNGAYFDNRSLSGTPLLTRQDAQIDFDWGYGSPSWEIPDNEFSVRWTRVVYFEPGSYRFTATTDDGVRLWVGEHPLIDNWRDQSLSRSGRP
jgi:hypothetical protein